MEYLTILYPNTSCNVLKHRAQEMNTWSYSQEDCRYLTMSSIALSALVGVLIVPPWMNGMAHPCFTNRRRLISRTLSPSCTLCSVHKRIYGEVDRRTMSGSTMLFTSADCLAYLSRPRSPNPRTFFSFTTLTTSHSHISSQRNHKLVSIPIMLSIHIVFNPWDFSY